MTSKLQVLGVLSLSLALCSCSSDVEEFEGDEAGECEDRADNDRDGQFDCDDDGCSWSPSCSGADGDADADADAPTCTDDEECDDGVFCNGEETCDPETGCQDGETPSCDDGVACTVDTCDLTADECLHGPVDEECDDGVFCNGEEVCNPSEGCAPGTPPDCSDDLDCIEDSCDVDTDACIFEPVDGDGDGDFPPDCGGGDCNDGDPSVSSTTFEAPCTGVDEDCDPLTDDAPDRDEDGFDICGPEDTVNPDGEQADCDDGDEAVNPESSESCDGNDNDCDGEADEDFEGRGLPCGDTDGECTAGTIQCIRGHIACLGRVMPSPEICDLNDNDCDGETDEGGICAATSDGDDDGVTPHDGDCDDGNPSIGPDASEICGDGIDNDCDTLVDGLDPDLGLGEVCDEGTGLGSTGLCAWGIKECHDGEVVCADYVGPVEEVCRNGLDDDCDGEVDEECDEP